MIGQDCGSRAQGLMIIRFIISLSLFFVSTASLAADLQAAFEALKNTKVNYNPDGAICEQLSILKVRQDYPETSYEITGGIEYDTGGATLGELDVVVLDKLSRKVVLIQEVKCWRDYDNGLVKAKSQRDRFMWNLTKHPDQIHFVSYNGESFSTANFSNSFPFVFISHLGGVRHGFDAELEFNLSDLKKLRMMLLKCQDSGACPKPE